MQRIATFMVAGFFVACGAGVATAAQLANPDDPDIRGLYLGMRAETMPQEGHYFHACGSNGGPPYKSIDGWTDFHACDPDDKGLYEVYVEFDDQLEYLVRAFPDLPPEENWLNKFAGTKIAGHPVIVSVLFDESGTVQGLRAVTDPRAEIGSRRRAYLLRNAIKARYGVRGWECVDLPPEPGETPIGDMFIKERCEKVYNDDRRVVISSRLLRRPGQDGVDEAGNFVEGEYESSTRLEIWSLSL